MLGKYQKNQKLLLQLSLNNNGFNYKDILQETFVLAGKRFFVETNKENAGNQNIVCEKNRSI